MNYQHFGIILLSVSILSFVQALVPNPGWEDEMVCKNNEHLTLPRSTCCRNQSHPVPFNYMTYWKECAVPPSDASHPLTQTLWETYGCVIGKALEGKPLDLKSYAMLMSKNLPDAVKTNIMKNAETMSSEAGGNIKMIRETYYKIEIQECIQRDVNLPPMDTCISDLERDHKHGGCCLKEQVPIATLVPYIPEKDVLDVWKDLLETVSVNDPNAIPYRVQKACESTCVQISLGKIKKEDLFRLPLLSESLDIFAPSFLSKKEVDDLKNSILSTMMKTQKNDEPLEKATVEAMEQHYMAYLQKELVGIKDEAKAKSMVVSCLFHQQVIQILAATFKMKCTDGPAPGA